MSDTFIYKIRNAAGQFSTGGINFKWSTTKGKVWKSRGALVKHIRLVQSYGYQKYHETMDIVQYKVTEHLTGVQPVPVFLARADRDRRNLRNAAKDRRAKAKAESFAKVVRPSIAEAVDNTSNDYEREALRRVLEEQLERLKYRTVN